MVLVVSGETAYNHFTMYTSIRIGRMESFLNVHEFTSVQCGTRNLSVSSPDLVD